MDLVKAFDKVNRSVLFEKLLSRHCPHKLVRILEGWYNKSFTSVSWCRKLSSPVLLQADLRQGSVFSPVLFSIYVNDILLQLEKSKLGCNVRFLYVNVFMYADDLLFVSSTIKDLQLMIDICIQELDKLDMCVNIKKSRLV